MFRFLRNQTPLTIFVEILFALLLLMIFLASQGRGFNLTSLRRSAEAPASLPSPTPSLAIFAAAPTTPPPTTPPLKQTPLSPENDDPLRGLDCQDLVVNGDFETVGGWQMPVTARPASLTNEQVYLGESSLKLGIAAADQHLAGESIAAQTVNLPADATVLLLRVQLWQGSDGDAADSRYLLLENNGLTRITFDDVANTRTWQPFSYDLTPLRGQSVRLLFGVNNDGENGRTVLYVDDLRVLACTSD